MLCVLPILILLYTNYRVESSPVIVGAFGEDEPDKAWEKLDALIKTSSEFEGDWQSEVSIIPSFKSGTAQMIPLFPQQEQEQLQVAPPKPQTVPAIPKQTQQHLLWGHLKPEETIPMIPQQTAPRDPSVPQPLNLPQFTVVMSPIGSGVFKPDSGTRPLPEEVKPMLLPPAPTPVSVPKYEGDVDALCHLDRMYVRIKKELFSTPEDARQYLKIGTCPVNQDTNDHYYFLYYLKGCGLKYEDKGSYSTFSNTLTYNPPATGLILRALPFSVNVVCKYYKNFYAYARGYHPELKAGTVFARLSPPSQLTLRPYDDKWEPIKPGHSFAIGKPMHFEAKVAATTVSGRTYINQCFITPTSNPNAEPRYTVIENNGCMVDSKTSASSKFIVNAVKTALRFSIGAFVFRDSTALPTGQRTLYLHCEIVEGPVTPTPSLKSCTYNRATKKWTELYDSASVCSCCETTCASAQPRGRMVSSDAWKLPEYAKESAARIEKAVDVPDLVEADDLDSGYEMYWSS